jgi:hypothetical protein
MNTEDGKSVRSLNRSLDRRGFIAGALTTGLVASAMPAKAIEMTVNGNSHYRHDAFKVSNAQGAIDKMKQTPPLRIGLRRIFNPSQGEKESWYINDHCFVQDDSGMWHLFGITGKEPANPANEKFFLHATAKDMYGPWVKQKPVMQVDPDAGETVVWAPYVLKHDSRYWMFYCGGGESHMQYRINLATSSDLVSWTRSPANPMVLDGYDARDPMVLRVGSQWVLYYCATESPGGGNHVVIAATSSDLIHWTGREIVFRSPQTGTFGGPTESPYVVAKDNKYYLFLCTNNPYNNTEVYVSDSPFHWNPEDVILRFDAHAAEVVNAGKGKWFLSAAGWGQGGLYLAELMWNDSVEE